MKNKTKFDVKNFLKDAGLTIIHLPLHVLLGVYAAFLQCGTQLYYDVQNNKYQVYDNE